MTFPQDLLRALGGEASSALPPGWRAATAYRNRLGLPHQTEPPNPTEATSLRDDRPRRAPETGGRSLWPVHQYGLAPQLARRSWPPLRSARRLRPVTLGTAPPFNV